MFSVWSVLGLLRETQWVLRNRTARLRILVVPLVVACMATFIGEKLKRRLHQIRSAASTLSYRRPGHRCRRDGAPAPVTGADLRPPSGDGREARRRPLRERRTQGFRAMTTSVADAGR